MNDEREEFVRQGFKSFPQAWEALSEFTSAVVARIEAAIAEAAVDGPFKPDPDAKVKNDWNGSPKEGCWIFASPTGLVGKTPRRLEVGYWWQSTRELPLIAYANIWYAMPEPTPLAQFKPAAPVQVRQIGQRSRLYVPLTAQTAGADELRQLIIEAGRWLAEAE